MKIDDLKLLGKDVTVKKNDGSFLKGYCLNQFSDRLIINPNGSDDRVVVVQAETIMEISFDDFKSVKTMKEMRR
jgi:hypothetical protein